RLSRRGNLIIAYLGFQLLLELITQVASIGHDLTQSVVAASWGGLLIILTALAWKHIRRALRNLPLGSDIRASFGRLVSRTGIENIFWLLVVCLILGILAYLGYSFLPSNGDS